MAIFYYISLVEQIRLFFKKGILPVKNKPAEADINYLNDLSDGSIYQLFRQSIIRSGLKFENVYSIIMNTDGISLFDSSSFTMWPMYGNLIESNIKERYYIDNTLIFGKIDVKISLLL
jgi:hypothetical protein